VFASASANAFAVFVVPFGSVPPPGTIIDFDTTAIVLPAEFGQGVPIIWNRTSKAVTLAFTPNPPGPLTNGTTTWNANAQSTINEWEAVGANFRFNGNSGTGNACFTDGNVVAAFDPTVCIGLVPPFILGLSRIVAVVVSATSIAMVDADVVMLTPDTVSTIGPITWDAFDGPTTPPVFDFRRTVLHEFGHSQGLAHPDMVFGDTAQTRATVMHSESDVDRLSRDDKNGVLALYPPTSRSVGGGGGSGSGGSGNALILALLLAVFVSFKFLSSRARQG
jgi:hypothetical protein